MMSFSKASVKRFNENTGCAPPVGSYDPKQKEKTGSLPFDKGGDRFKAPKDILPGPGAFDIDTPVKKPPLNASTCSNGGEKKKVHRSSENLAEMAKIKDLEREIKKLVQERVSQDKLLTQRESDIIKLEGRLQLTHTDKISMQAKIATLEKELKEVKKSNEVLKNKMTTADSAVKKQENLQTELSSLKHQLECKTKEIVKIKHELENARSCQSADLQIFENVVKSLEERVQKFDLNEERADSKNGLKIAGSKLNVKEEKLRKTETSSISAEKLQKRFNQALCELESKVQQYKDRMDNRYSVMMEDKQSLEHNLKQVQEELDMAVEKSDNLEKSRLTLSKQYEALQKMIKDLRSETWNQEDRIRFLKGEVFSTADNRKEEGQMLFEVKAEKASLMEKLDVLEEENGTLNMNIKTLTEKYHVLEGRLAEEQNQNNVKSDQVQSQLDVTKSHLMKVQDEYQLLQAKNKELVHSINKEKECVEKLIFEMDEQKQLSCDLQNLVVDNEDKITDLEISLEATKVELQNVMDIVDSKETDIMELKARIQQLEAIERSLQGQIEQENNVNMRTVRQHADRILELENLEITVTEENIKLCRKLEESNEKMCATEGKLDHVIKDLDKVKEESKVKVESLLNQLELVVEEKVCIQKNLEMTQSDSDKLKKEVNGLQDKMKVKVEELESEKQCQIEIVHEMNGNIQRLLQEKQNLIINLESLTLELDTVKTDNVKLIEQIEDLEKVKKDKKTSDDKIKQLDIKFNSLNKENTQLMNEIEFLQQSKEHDQSELKEKIEIMEKYAADFKEKQKLQNDVICEHMKSIEEAQSREDELERQKLKLTSRLQQVTDEREAISKQFSGLISSLEEVRNKSAEKEEEWRSDYETLTNDLQTVTEERDVLHQRITSVEEEKVALAELVKHLETKIENLVDENKKEIDAVTNTVNQLLQDEEDIKHENHMLKSMTENLQQALEDKVLLTQSLENDVEKLVQEMNIHKDFKLKYETKVEEICEIEEEMQAKASRIDSLQRKFDELESGKKLLNKQVSDMDNLMESLSIENSRLENELEKKESVIERITSKYETQVKSLTSDIEVILSKNKDMSETVQCLEDTVKEMEEEAVKYQNKIELLKSEMSATENRASGTIEDLDKLLESAVEREGELKMEVQSLQSLLQTVEEDKENMAKKYEDELTDLRDKTRTMEDTHWKKSYEDLMTKVEPFMSQLDAYEMEKTALLGRNKFAQAELDKLSTEYGKLLGHQNQKQKIHHIIKIKEENNSLKKETATLREQVNKLKRSNQKLEEKMSDVEGKRRFDPSKAFQHKENTAPPSSPLRDGNRK